MRFVRSATMPSPSPPYADSMATAVPLGVGIWGIAKRLE